MENSLLTWICGSPCLICLFILPTSLFVWIGGIRKNASCSSHCCGMLDNSLFKTFVGDPICAPILSCYHAILQSLQELLLLLVVWTVHWVLCKSSSVYTSWVWGHSNICCIGYFPSSWAWKFEYSPCFTKFASTWYKWKEDSGTHKQSIDFFIQFRLLPQLYIWSIGMDFIFSYDSMFASRSFHSSWTLSDVCVGFRKTSKLQEGIPKLS